MTDNISPEAEALDAILSSKQDRTESDALLPSIAEEAQLAEELQILAESIQADPEYKVALESRLIGYMPNNPPGASGSRISRILVLGSLALLFLLGLAWAINGLLPFEIRSPASKETTISGIGPTPAQMQITIEASPSMIPKSPAPPTPTTSNQFYSIAIQPDVDLYLNTNFPDAPKTMTIFRQDDWEDLTLKNALELSAKIGIDGSAFISQNEKTGLDDYLVWDGHQKATFYSTIHWFDYESNNPSLIEKATCHTPCSFAETENPALDFLQGLGLLDIQAFTRPSDTHPHAQQLIQVLNGVPLLYRPGEYQGEAWIGTEGEILRLNYRPVKVIELGEFPIISAEQAWEIATSTQTKNGIEIYSSSAHASDNKIWYQTYPQDTYIDLFGSLTIFQSAVKGEAPLILFDGFPVEGNIQGMSEIDPNNNFVQVWGKFVGNEAGGLDLRVDGWQRSAFPLQNITGKVILRGDKAFFQTENLGLYLPDLPADVPEGEVLTARGVVIEQPLPTLVWSSISTIFQPASSTSDAAFLELDLDAEKDKNLQGTQTPDEVVAIPTADLSGTQVNGLVGRPVVFITQYTDGSSRVEIHFYPDPGQNTPSEPVIILEGPGLAEIEPQHNLPTRIWGSFGDPINNIPRINVERIEPVYSGLMIQTWLGRFEKILWEGKEYLLFSANDGQQYILDLENTEFTTGSNLTYGDPVVIEGYIKPDAEISGFKVIKSYILAPGQGLQGLSGYQSQSVSPRISQKSGTAGAPRKVFVSLIELAYVTKDMSHAMLAGGEDFPYVQPVWRFTGSYDDGAVFELLVQALDRRYLHQP